ncbi:MAG: hypothetical protein JHC33_01155 [Ignisphaera sp.]|jgi:hypothetical protein|nr:hypothetical protein [Ignisphaera sp.]
MPTYRSRFEGKVAAKFIELGIDAAYEAEKLPYIVPETKKNYIPDWTIGDIRIETKGRLTAIDRRKMILVKQYNPNIRIILIFMNSDVKLRKGSPTSYGQWANKAGFEWYDWRKGLPRQLIKELKDEVTIS